LEHHVLCLASLFATQQNPRVILWTDAETFSKLTPLARIFSQSDFTICLGSVEDAQRFQSSAFRADRWRLEILKELGGIYFDMDIVFFKDISWFANYGRPIVHEGYPTEDVFNNAILYFPKNHPGVIYWLSLIRNRRIDWDIVFETQRKSDDNFGADMLPNSVSDIGWCGSPTHDEFFERAGLTHECMGDSFLYHWHNRWTKSLRIDNTLANLYWNKYVLTNISSAHT
jgi:hypothetical protein